MAAFTAINVGMRIPGIIKKMKDLAKLPASVVLASTGDGGKDALMNPVRGATHFFNLIMGRGVGSKKRGSDGGGTGGTQIAQGCSVYHPSDWTRAHHTRRKP